MTDDVLDPMSNSDVDAAGDLFSDIAQSGEPEAVQQTLGVAGQRGERPARSRFTSSWSWTFVLGVLAERQRMARTAVVE